MVRAGLRIARGQLVLVDEDDRRQRLRIGIRDARKAETSESSRLEPEVIVGQTAEPLQRFGPHGLGA
jgi:hypothetical protein